MVLVIKIEIKIYLSWLKLLILNYLLKIIKKCLLSWLIMLF